MRAIYKYTIPLAGEVRIGMLAGAVPRHVCEQRGTICVWAEVDTEAGMVDRTFYVVGTGHPLPVGMAYIGTVHLNELVFHIYDGGE